MSAPVSEIGRALNVALNAMLAQAPGTHQAPSIISATPMTHSSLHASLAAFGLILFASGPPRLWRRRTNPYISRAELLLPFAMLFALTAISAVGAIEYPLSLTDALNQF